MADRNPYADAKPHQLWRRALAETRAADVDPVTAFPFRIARADKIVTAGSCFAQHLSRRLQANQYAYLVTETAHPVLTPSVAEAFQYGLYSARYGNIYTARQLLQLQQRAYGAFAPRDDLWESDGRYYDPFRPRIQPQGFATRAEYDRDRQQHFAAVRRAFEEMDVFIFTLGLTECWAARADGAIYPMCPGTAAGTFDSAQHQFVNFGVDEIVADLNAFLDQLETRNPRAKTILTVSPVPLVATAEDKHVLVSTTYSKSVLRVAAEILSRRPRVAYFPSYEIITGAFSRGRYFAEDLRGITEDGVDHVMRVFFEHATESAGQQLTAAADASATDDFIAKSQAMLDVVCEEESLDKGI